MFESLKTLFRPKKRRGPKPLVLTQEFVAQVAADYRGGQSVLSIAGARQVPEGRVRRALSMANVKMRPPGTAQSANIVRRNAQIVDLRKSGKTLKEIGEAFGITRERVRQVLLTENVEGPQVSIKEVRNDAMADDYLAGMPPRKISERYGLSHERVRFILRNHPKTEWAWLKNSHRKRGSMYAPQIPAMWAMYQAGSTMVEIGARYGLAPGYVSRLFGNYGYTARNAGQTRKMRRTGNVVTIPHKGMIN